MPSIKSILPLLLVSFIMAACRENYEPPAIKDAPSVLVVDGFLNNSVNDTSFIQLSRTSKLAEGPANSGESGAQLTIEDEDGNPVYYSQENFGGSYMFPGIYLDPVRKYKLRIRTLNGQEYLTDALQSTTTPPIDSLGFDRTDKGVDIYVNTHDPNNNTRYYRWEYSETFQYHATYFSSLLFTGNGEYKNRPGDQLVYECWKTEPSSELLLGSSSKLSEDIIYKNILRHVDQNAIELSTKYFIKVKQFALTKGTYNYLENLKKISEETGSLFDIQPSQVSGNIHGVTNTGENVIGYMTIVTPQIREIYINNEQVAPWFYQANCFSWEIDPKDIPQIVTPDTPLGLYLDGNDYSLKGVFVASPDCADCRAMGGVTTKPDFWQ